MSNSGHILYFSLRVLLRNTDGDMPTETTTLSSVILDIIVFDGLPRRWNSYCVHGICEAERLKEEEVPCAYDKLLTK